MSETLQEAFQFYKRGEKQKATKLLAALVIQEPNNASAWMGLGVCLDNKEKQIYCFQKVLSLDPQNSQAKEMLEQLSPDPETEKCPHCGESIYEGANICQNCGRDLQVRSEVEPEISKDSDQQTQPEAPNLETKKCPYCGESIHEGANWCRNCGRNLRDVSSVEQESSDADIPESQPEKLIIQHSPEARSVERKPDRTRITSSLIGGVLIIGLIGVLAAILFVFYQMNPQPLATPETRVFIPNPTKTNRPPAATPNPSSITPPYFEDFSDGAGIWHVRNDEEVSFEVSDGKYVIQPKYPGASWWTSPRAQLEDIQLEFTTSFGYTYPMEDGGFRVNFRCKDIDEELCYIMTIAENGYLFVHRDAETLVEHKLSQHINLYDHPNEWAIVMNGSEFDIYCNEELLTSFSDSKYKSGDFGFGVFNSTSDKWGFNGVAFDNIRVSSLE